MTCLVEGAPQPDPVKRPPNDFNVRARQEIDTDKKTGKLSLSFEGSSVGKRKVEVTYEDSDKKVSPKDLDTKVEFDLPELWIDDPGPRFVTVYLRERATAPAGRETHKAKEEPTTIVLIIPAPVFRADVQDFDEFEGVATED